MMNKYERCTFQVKTQRGCLYVKVSEWKPAVLRNVSLAFSVHLTYNA